MIHNYLINIRNRNVIHCITNTFSIVLSEMQK